MTDAPDVTVITGGIKKFVNELPGLGAGAANNLGQYIPVAVPDTSAYPGSDYYVIELGEYTEQMHSDLPPTTLRGYRQANMGGTPYNYLGPAIVATKDRPVRILFRNLLPTGMGGNLFIPVDTTVMGAGAGPRVTDATRLTTDGQQCVGAVKADCYTQNRATIHLHGGVTPWISDGTPHQWITPASQTTPYPEGVSVVDVPDMPTPGPGEMNFFYTNQQSARLMFYHDHAYGITRLGAYVGEAAGYVLTDQVEDDLIDGTNVSGGNPGGTPVLPNLGGLYRYGIPLVIQDRLDSRDPRLQAIFPPLLFLLAVLYIVLLPSLLRPPLARTDSRGGARGGGAFDMGALAPRSARPARRPRRARVACGGTCGARARRRGAAGRTPRWCRRPTRRTPSCVPQRIEPRHIQL